MDGEHGFGVGEAAAELGLEGHGDQGRLPVVALDHVGPEVQIAQAGQDRFGEEGVPLAVIQAAVDGIPVKILVVVDEVDLELFLPGFQPEQAHVALPPGQSHGEAGDELTLPAAVPLDLAVVGQEQADRVAGQLAQGLGQSLHHVAKTAGLDKRGSFGGCDCDFHTVTPFLITRG